MRRVKHLRTRDDLDQFALTESHWNKIQCFAEQAVSVVNITDKTTNQIFGELYTRVRTLCSFSQDPELMCFVRGRIKNLNYTDIGKRLNLIIREAYYNKYDNNTTTELELCMIFMRNCIEEAKTINKESETILSNFSKLDEDLRGENYGE